MSDWITVIGPRLVEPTGVEWRHKTIWWGNEVHPQEEYGYVRGQRLISRISVEHTPKHWNAVPHYVAGWHGIVIELPLYENHKEVREAIVDFILKQPVWVFHCELNAHSSPSDYIYRKSEVEEVTVTVEHILGKDATHSYVLWN